MTAAIVNQHENTSKNPIRIESNNLEIWKFENLVIVNGLTKD